MLRLSSVISAAGTGDDHAIFTEIWADRKVANGCGSNLIVGTQIGGWSEVLRFICLVMIGNFIGGSLFVAGLNYAQFRQSQPANSEK
jgi:formate/nitrite transporter FocA (FNT family)